MIELENNLSGYFCIITSEKMTAKKALLLYKNRDASEKLFRGDKSYLGDKSLRVYGDSAAESKIFIEFIALIIRNRIYNYLKDEWIKLDKRDSKRKEELWNFVIQSNKSYEEILQLIVSPMSNQTE